MSRFFRRATECLKSASAAEVMKVSRFPWIDGQLRIERAVCAFHDGQFELALKGLERALAHITTSRYETLYLRGLGAQAGLQTMLGDTATAAQTDWRGLELYWQGAHSPNRAYQFYSDLFMSAEREHRWRSAYMFALEAVDTVALGWNRLTEGMARSKLAEFALRVGEKAIALQQTEAAANLLRQFGDRPSAQAYRLQNLIILASAYLAAGRTGDAAKMLGMLESQNADSIIARLAVHRTYGLVRDAEQQWEHARQELLTAAGIARNAIQNLGNDASRLQWKRESDLVFRTLTRIELDHVHRPEAALAFWEWFRSAPVRGQAVPLPTPENAVGLLRSRLSAHTTSSVISWAQIDNRIAVWLLDDRGVRFAWSPAPASRCKALRAQFSRLCSQPDSNVATLRAIGRELYEALVGPIADHLDANRVLLVEPDVVPGSIAFEALVRPDGRWLGEHFTIVTSPGLWAELALRERPSVIGSTTAALIIGNPSYSPVGSEVFSPLPDAEREAEFVQRLFSSGRSLLRSAATPRAVTASLTQAELFHFAGHARFDGESARLLLAGTGASLDSKAIEEHGRNCRLAVLSACSTAGPDREGPWNVESLVQSFWRAGTPLVIASRWEVDSNTTARLFAEFYKQLTSGENGAESLRRAAAATRVLPGSTHPYFWAAFHAFGSLPMNSVSSKGDAP
jgi:CHAT domain-containing protein/tetratricopeptide (TPR) repeat protein